MILTKLDRNDLIARYMYKSGSETIINNFIKGEISMILTKVDVNSMNTRYMNKSSAKTILTEFLNMNTPAVRIDDVTGYYKTLHGAYNSLYNAIRKHNLPIQIMWADDSIFLMRIDGVEDEPNK
jgi:hypothetical protein